MDKVIIVGAGPVRLVMAILLAVREIPVVERRPVIGAAGAGSFVRPAPDLEFKGSTYTETTVMVSTTFPFEAHIEGRRM